MENTNTSSIVAQQLPSFVREDYPKFVTFLEKYYEWLEQNNEISYELNALKNAKDIDQSDDFYIEQLKRDLLPYFPQEIVGNKRLFLKLVTQFYKASGTQNSVKFLFRALFNDNIDIYYPKEDIFRASDGKWSLPLALRIDTTDENIFNISGTLITGSLSKSTAIVENVIRSVDRQLGISYIEVYISNVNRLFITGETVTSTYINEITGLPVSVSGRLIGALSEFRIDPLNRGLFYRGFEPENNYDGDPVSITGGLNPNADTPIGAVAFVGNVTKGGITDINTIQGGFGFRNPIVDPNTTVVDFQGGFRNAVFGTEAKASVALVDESVSRTVNVSSLSVSTLAGMYSNIAGLADIIGTVVDTDTPDANSETILNISTYQSFNVHPISFVVIDGSGGGYSERPRVDTFSLYNEEFDDSLIFENAQIFKGNRSITNNSVTLTSSLEKDDYVRLFVRNRLDDIKKLAGVTDTTIEFDGEFENDITGVQVFKLNRNVLSDIGSIGRINIIAAGSGYANGDILIFNGGSGYGANGFVNVAPTGEITTVTINNHSEGAFVIGGEGYRSGALPTITIQTATGANAILTVAEIVGNGEEYALTTSRIGAISSIRVTSFGYDYVEAPRVSLRNADLFVNNVTEGQLFIANTIVYQGTSNTNTTFKATVDTFDVVTGKLRIFDYRGTIQSGVNIRYDSEESLNAVTANVVSSQFYGDGLAKVTARFENGLIRYPGVYLNTDGHISSDKKFQDANKYHDFSYVIQSKVDYNKFKKPLNDIVHPIGTKTLVIRLDDNVENFEVSNAIIYLTETALDDTYNIALGANTISVTNVSANLQSTVNVGDFIIVNGINRALQNTVNVVSGSNIMFGAAESVNFINDIQAGDIITLSTGNTVSIKEVTNSSHAILNTVIGVTSTDATLNLVYSEVTTVISRNVSTIITDTNFKDTGRFLTASVRKVR